MRNSGGSLFAHLPRLLVVTVVVLWLLCLPGAVSAADTTSVAISSPADPLEPGRQFTIGIVVVPGTDIAGMQFDLHFDPSLVAVDDITEGDLLGHSGASTFFNQGHIDNQAGTITGAFGAITSPGETVSAPGTFATITLTARKQIESCPLNLSNVVVGDKDGNAVPVTLDNQVSPNDTVQRPVYRWWILAVILAAALILIAATIIGILFRRRQMAKALQVAGRQDRGA